MVRTPAAAVPAQDHKHQANDEDEECEFVGNTYSEPESEATSDDSKGDERPRQLLTRRPTSAAVGGPLVSGRSFGGEIGMPLSTIPIHQAGSAGGVWIPVGGWWLRRHLPFPLGRSNSKLGAGAMASTGRCGSLSMHDNAGAKVLTNSCTTADRPNLRRRPARNSPLGAQLDSRLLLNCLWDSKFRGQFSVGRSWHGGDSPARPFPAQLPAQ